MPRPKGCRCGHGPCPVHPDREPNYNASATTHAARKNSSPDGDERSADRAELKDAGRKIDGAAGAAAGAPTNLHAIDGGKTRRDPPPRQRKRQKAMDPDKPDDQALQTMLSELLVMPAIPAAMLLDCNYCRDHFLYEGPKAARELVALSMTNPALRGALESMHAAWAKITIAGVIAGYVAKPMLHHMAPEPILDAAGPVLGVPPRPAKPKHEHAASETSEHASPPAGHAGPAPEDQHSGDPAAGIDAA